MAQYNVGIDYALPYSQASLIPNDLFWNAINFYAQRCPMLARLDRRPVGSPTFTMVNDNFRPRVISPGITGAYSTTGTTLAVPDGSMFMKGDVLRIDTEDFIVTADPVANNLTVSFAFNGTTNAAHSANAPITLITNARTGREIDQSAISRVPTGTLQYVQTIQEPYQVGGLLEDSTAFMDGQVDPLTRDRSMAIQHTMDDAESVLWYGKGAAATGTGVAEVQVTKGMTTLFQANNTFQPSGYAAYKPSDFIRDIYQTPFAKGGAPDICFVSANFMVGLAKWGWNLQHITPMETVLGARVQTIAVPWLPGVEIVPSPVVLPSGTAVAFNKNEVRVRIMRQLTDKPRGSRGDAVEGDIIMRLALEVQNEAHGAVVTGITGFAAES